MSLIELSWTAKKIKRQKWQGLQKNWMSRRRQIKINFFCVNGEIEEDIFLKEGIKKHVFIDFSCTRHRIGRDRKTKSIWLKKKLHQFSKENKLFPRENIHFICDKTIIFRTVPVCGEWWMGPIWVGYEQPAGSVILYRTSQYTSKLHFPFPCVLFFFNKFI